MGQKVSHGVNTKLARMTAPVKPDVRHDPMTVRCLGARAAPPLAHRATHDLHEPEPALGIGSRTEMRFWNARWRHAEYNDTSPSGLASIHRRANPRAARLTNSRSPQTASPRPAEYRTDARDRAPAHRPGSR